ncbi:MAG: hypothetical protein B7X08_01595 [Acidocella sp. 20-63-7]|nr:MAG: hypothetical protein B7X08_01595 [Acidocella sp. 20-63-7]
MDYGSVFGTLLERLYVKKPDALNKIPLDKISKLNDQIAIRSNQIFATMGFFWFCLVFSLLPLKWPATMPFVQYASSGVLQLIALPLLGVGTLLAARSSDQLAKEQHDAVMETVKNMHVLMTELHQLHVELTAKVTEVLDAQDDADAS